MTDLWIIGGASYPAAKGIVGKQKAGSGSVGRVFGWPLRRGRVGPHPVQVSVQSIRVPFRKVALRDFGAAIAEDFT